MRFYVMIFLLGLSCVCLTLAQVSYEDCCLKYVTKVSHRHAVSYRLQETDGGCNIPAVVFTMKRGRVLCADRKEPWVQKLMDKINRMKPYNKRQPNRQRQNRG